MIPSTDSEIRKAFHIKKLSVFHNQSDAMVIDELGVIHGKNRIDIAVVNGHIHGYEIKSSKDNLSRFSSQLDTYIKCFEKLTIISAENHIKELKMLTPEWCGIILAKKGAKGGITFSTIRKATNNPNVDIIAMAHFLWKKEAIELLTNFGASAEMLKGSREKLYRNISKVITIPELSLHIKKLFMKRDDWRADLQPKSCGG